MSWKVVVKRTVAEFKTEAEANAYLDHHLPMEDEDFQKEVYQDYRLWHFLELNNETLSGIVMRRTKNEVRNS